MSSAVAGNSAGSAAGAIFANGFVNEGVEFVAREGDVRPRGLTGVVSFRKLGAAAGGRSDKIASARSHELGHFAAGKKNRAARQLRRENDLGKVLDGFHAKEGGQKIRAASDSTMIRQEQSVIMRDEGLDGVA